VGDAIGGFGPAKQGGVELVGTGDLYLFGLPVYFCVNYALKAHCHLNTFIKKGYNVD